MRRSFVAGPFSGELVSTLVLRPDTAGGGSSSTSSGAPPLPRPAKKLVEYVDLRYRVNSLPSTLAMTFQGASEPLCAVVDSCGVTGSLAVSIPRYRDTLSIIESRIVRHRVGPRRAFHKMVMVSESLTLIRLQGHAVVSFGGSANPDVCALLDSCGVSGTLALRPVPRDATGSLTALGPARLPKADYLAALGLRPGAVPKSIEVFGGIDWNDAGTLNATLARAGDCSDVAPLGTGALTFEVQARLLMAVYAVPSPLRTRCPGPIVSLEAEGLSGSTGLGRLASRTFTVTARTGEDLMDDGYTGRIHGQTSFSIRRGRVSEQTLSLPS